MYRDDSDLIRACLTGSEIAWKELVDHYSRLVYSVALKHDLSLEDANDVLQEVFTIAFRHLHNLRDHKLIAAWLITIAIHECQRLHRRIPATVEIDETLPDPSDSPVEEVQVWERRHVVRQALGQLEPRCRAILEMLFLETPMTYVAIADRVGIPVGSVGPIRARCFRKLEVILTEMDVDLDS